MTADAVPIPKIYDKTTPTDKPNTVVCSEVDAHLTVKSESIERVKL